MRWSESRSKVHVGGIGRGSGVAQLWIVRRSSGVVARAWHKRKTDHSKRLDQATVLCSSSGVSLRFKRATASHVRVGRRERQVAILQSMVTPPNNALERT